MPTSISNPASFSSVRTAFNTEGYGISTSLFAYRQGGGIVPATSEFNAIGAGTGGDPLQLSQFNGFSVPSVIDIDDVEVFNDIATPTAAFYQLNSDGNIYISNLGLRGSWKLSASASSLYEARMVKTNITTLVSVGAALNTWLNLGTSREWAFDTSEGESGRQTCSLDIRLASTGAILDSASEIAFNWVGEFG